MLPDNTNVPAPALVIPKVEPLITPPKVKVLADAVIVGVVVKVIAPVLCLISCDPV